MGLAIDRNRGHAGQIAEHQVAISIEQCDEIELADVSRQAQLQRPTQLRLAVAHALGRFVDQNGASVPKIGRVHLPVNEGESGGCRQGYREREREREAKRPRIDDLKYPHSV